MSSYFFTAPIRHNHPNDYGCLYSAAMLLLIGIWFVAATAGGCNVSQSRAEKILEPQSFTDIQTTGYEWFACADLFSTGFRAVAPTGQPVSGTVCCGLLRGCTVRW